MNKGMLLINFELTLNVIYLEKQVQSGIGKMQDFLYYSIRYRSDFVSFFTSFAAVVIFLVDVLELLAPLPDMYIYTLRRYINLYNCVFLIVMFYQYLIY